MSVRTDRDLQALFEAIAALPHDQRTAALSQACGSDPARRVAVEALLADLDADVDDEPRAMGGLGAFSRDSAEGAAIGAYRVVRELGAGGMGVVYLAERDDGLFDKHVAIKLVRLGLFASPERQQRFHLERRLQARFEHPHIVRVHDAGLTPEGAPYFVMEYLADAQPVTDYCDAHRLSVEDRLRLFVQGVEAVAYIQRRLVVHRDLKPSNLLVTAPTPAEGERGPHVKLLDFGLAKLLEEDHPHAPLTQTGERLLTPEYAAPEQTRGDEVTTATDVYALGVVLYELLAGCRPYAIEQRHSAADVERIVSDHEPKRPSAEVIRDAEERSPAQVAEARATTPERLAQRLRGDLDTIVLKALAKEPDRRYPSADALLDDLCRHLDDLPIAARPSTAGYRVRKFVRRHRTGVAATVAAALLVLGFGALHTARVTAERDRAEAALTQAKQVSGFTIDLFRQADPNETAGDSLTARALLDQGALRVRDELADLPAVRAEMQEVIGQVNHVLGSYDQAAALLAEALAVRRAEGDEAATGRTLFLLGDAHYNRGAYEEAEALMRESVVLRRAALGEAHPGVAESLRGLAAVLYDQGRIEEAEEHYREALRLLHSAHGPDHPDVGSALSDLGTFLDQARRDPEAAEPLLRQALDVQRRHHGEQHGETARTLSQLGLVLDALGRHAEAEPLHRRAVAVSTALVGAAHYSTLGTMSNLGLTLIAQERYAEAEAVYRSALDRLTGTQGDEDYGRALLHLNLARALEGQDRAADAEQAAREGEVLLDGLFGRGHHLTASAVHIRGEMLQGAARRAEAEAAFREALATRQAVGGDAHLSTVQSKVALGRLLIERGTDAEAERLLREAAAVEAAPGSGQKARAAALLGLAQILIRRGETSQAERLAREAVALYEASLPAGHSRLAEARRELAAVRTLLNS